jgi:hypothetical protein
VNYAQLLFPDFSLILIGYLICRFTALNRSIWVHVDALVYYLLFPTLLFYSIIKSPLDLDAAAKLVGAGWTVVAVGVALAYALPFLPGLRKHMPVRLHAASVQVGFRFNSFIALALAERLAGPAGLLEIAVLIGVCVPLVNVAAVWPMARGSQKHFGKELLRNPLILATASGLLANLCGLSLPHWLEPTVSRIGASSLALGLMAAGGRYANWGFGQWQSVGHRRLAHSPFDFPAGGFGSRVCVFLKRQPSHYFAGVLCHPHRSHLLCVSQQDGL